MKRLLLSHTDFANQTEASAVQDILKAILSHLNMEISFLTEFMGEKRIYRYVDSEIENNPIQAGVIESLDATYYQLIAKGEVPELINDARNSNDISIPESTKIHIGSYINVPLYLSDGSLFGTFCCLSRQSDPSLNQRDLALTHAFAELACKAIERIRRIKSIKQITLDVVNKIIRGESMYIAYQPIFDLLPKKNQVSKPYHAFLISLSMHPISGFVKHMQSAWAYI